MANYGTVNSAEGRNGHPNNSSNAERAALIGNKSEDSPGFVTLCSKHLGCNVSKTWGDIALLFCYIITGLLDSSSIFIWGSFVSMQTGEQAHPVHYKSPPLETHTPQATPSTSASASSTQEPAHAGSAPASPSAASAWEASSSAPTTARSRRANAGSSCHRTRCRT